MRGRQEKVEYALYTSSSIVVMATAATACDIAADYLSLGICSAGSNTVMLRDLHGPLGGFASHEQNAGVHETKANACNHRSCCFLRKTQPGGSWAIAQRSLTRTGRCVRTATRQQARLDQCADLDTATVFSNTGRAAPASPADHLPPPAVQPPRLLHPGRRQTAQEKDKCQLGHPTTLRAKSYERGSRLV
eukprot:scaffold14551_cov61-Phaeocystis_antarctica.AAC.6